MNDCNSWVEMTPRSARSNSESKQDTKRIAKSDLKYSCKLLAQSVRIWSTRIHRKRLAAV